LARGKKNLSALKAVAAKPTTSPASKKTLEQMIVDQGVLNAKVEKMLGIPPAAPG
jgi:hypothetical protein